VRAYDGLGKSDGVGHYATRFAVSANVYQNRTSEQRPSIHLASRERVWCSIVIILCISPSLGSTQMACADLSLARVRTGRSGPLVFSSAQLLFMIGSSSLQSVSSSLACFITWFRNRRGLPGQASRKWKPKRAFARVSSLSCPLRVAANETASILASGSVYQNFRT